MSENTTLEQKLTEAVWTNEVENNLPFAEEEMKIFNRISNEIAENRGNYFQSPQDELKFYEREKKQYLVHTRKKI